MISRFKNTPIRLIYFIDSFWKTNPKRLHATAQDLITIGLHEEVNVVIFERVVKNPKTQKPCFFYRMMEDFQNVFIFYSGLFRLGEARVSNPFSINFLLKNVWAAKEFRSGPALTGLNSSFYEWSHLKKFQIQDRA